MLNDGDGDDVERTEKKKPDYAGTESTFIGGTV